jgi:protease-4
MSELKISFWKIFWPSVIASVCLSVIGWIFWLTVLGGVFSQEPEQKVTTVLHMKLEGEIAERSSSSFNSTRFAMDQKIGLADLLAGFSAAKKDPQVKGIYLELGNVNCGYATAYELRNAIKDFRKSGKFVVAYLAGEVITQKQYFISSAASTVYGFSNSAMEFVGLGAELMFFKKTFDKVGLEMQVVRGSNNDFKSAVEPYFRENMSDSSKLQVQRYLNSIWGDMCSQIAAERKISVSTLNWMAEKVAIHRVDDAVKYHLIDAVKYRDEVEAIVAKKGGLSDFSEMMSFEKYAKERFKLDQLLLTDETGAEIAVVVAEGAITVDGDEMTSQHICNYFRTIRNDKHIKAVVFRINSPGGSALASEEIWREVSLTAKTKKVIVSMGDVAASGGYYIATPAETIFAEPTTITGSIGVFGVIPYTGAMLENNFGLTFDRVQTNAHAVLSLNRKMTEQEFGMVQREVDQIYDQFKLRVSNGRGLTVQQVGVIARGRVWTGSDALKIGLVDRIGGLTDAIQYAKKKIGKPKAIVRFFPIVKEDPIEALLEEFSQKNQTRVSLTGAKLPKVVEETVQKLLRLDQMCGIQMRLPYEIQIH